MTNAEMMSLCDTMGVGVKSHSSTLIEAQADRLRRRAERDGLTRPEQPEEPKPVKKSAKKAAAPKADAPEGAEGEAPKPAKKAAAKKAAAPKAEAAPAEAPEVAAPAPEVAAPAPVAEAPAPAPAPVVEAPAPAPAPEPAASEPPRMRTIEAYGEQVADGIKVPTTTPQVSARQFGDRSYLLARGSFIPCVLETQLISTVAGSSNCVVPEHVYSENGKVLLIEKGSKIIGEYKSDVKQGDVRIAIVWQRIKTPTGVVIDVDSPTTDAVGAMGVEGGVDYHWAQRIGAAVLLSWVGDAIDIEKARSANSSTTVVTGQNTQNTTKSLAEKILDSTINMPPTISKNRGDRVTVYLNRDLWFNTVYTHAQTAAR